MLTSASRRNSLAGVVFAVCIMAPSVASAQFGSPPRPVAGFKNSAAFGLSYGVNNTRDADFWGWSAEYSRKVGDRWFAAASIMWDRETETVADAPDSKTDTYTAAVTISYGLTKRLSVTTGLGKGFANTDNPSGSMRFTSGDLATGIVLGWSTPGLRCFERDSIAFSLAYEYNITQNETTLSFDIAFGWSF